MTRGEAEVASPAAMSGVPAYNDPFFLSTGPCLKAY